MDRSYIGGLGFGLTACDPTTVQPASLPDDSDLLLDRLEYWVVNKDVCRNPEIEDELSFHISDDGSQRFMSQQQFLVKYYRPVFPDKKVPDEMCGALLKPVTLRKWSKLRF